MPGLLPRDVPAFTGREGELARLADLAGGGRAVVAAIGGTAGVGKTALAVHAAHRMLRDFPDGHLYADLRGYTEGRVPAAPGEVLEMFLRRLGLPTEEIPADVEERSGVLRQLLASRRVLILLDNAATEAQVKPLLPGAGSSLVLITSRSVLPGLEVDERIGLDILGEEEADALLAVLIGDERAATESQAMARVRDWCGRLPLALRISGQLLAAHPAWPVARLAAMLARERDRLARLSAGDLQVRAAFTVSYRQLADEDARMFRLLGLHPGSDFNVVAAARLAGVDVAAAGPVLNRLVEASLVTEDAEGRFGMHDLLCLYALQTSQESDEQSTCDAAELRLVSYYVDLATFLNGCCSPRLRPVMEQAAAQAGGSLLSSREALEEFDAERHCLLAAAGLAAQRGWHEQVVRLGEEMAGGLILLHYLDDLLTVQEAVLAAARQAGDSAGEGTALRNLALAYSYRRRFEEVIICSQGALAICRETSDRYGEGLALADLGHAYKELRRFDEATGCYQAAVAAFRETGERHGDGLALRSLGDVHRELRRFDEAIGCYQEAVAIFRETGECHGDGLALLGDVYRELRRFDEAIGCYQEAVAIFRETGDWYGTGRAMADLGDVYRELRRFDEAIGCYQEAVAIFRETGDWYGTGRAMADLGDVYRELRRFDEAIGCYQEAVAIRRETGDRYGVGLILAKVAYVYLELRRFEEAVGRLQDALVIFRETGDRYAEGMALASLGDVYLELRRFEEAVGCCQDAVAIFRETGDRHSEGRALRDLGNAYQGLRQPDRSAMCWQDAASAMRHAGEQEEAAELERLSANARSRRRWRHR